MKYINEAAYELKNISHLINYLIKLITGTGYYDEANHFIYCYIDWLLCSMIFLFCRWDTWNVADDSSGAPKISQPSETRWELMCFLSNP